MQIEHAVPRNWVRAKLDRSLSENGRTQSTSGQVIGPNVGPKLGQTCVQPAKTESVVGFGPIATKSKKTPRFALGQLRPTSAYSDRAWAEYDLLALRRSTLVLGRSPPRLVEVAEIR